MKNINFNFNLQLFAAFDAPTTMTKTTTEKMSPTMKEFYNTALLENSREASVFNQFGKRQAISHGKSVEWRKFDTFAPATTPLTEGVAPEGKTLGMSNVTATLSQHGDFVPVSDVLEYASVDDVIFGATEEMGNAGGETDDILTRNALLTGTNVAFAPNFDKATGTSDVTTKRSALNGTALLTPALVNKAATFLKKMKAPKINGYYIAIIHPSVAEDLRNSDEWKEFHKYNAVNPIFKGEIGELHGIKFIESNNAKIWGETNGAVYATLFFGADAWGKVDAEGMGMEMIIKDKSEIGGPLEQYSTIGYKFMHAAKILYEERIIRVESNSSYSNIDEAN
jgi:N4-gp56 family major capsid protein